MQIAIARQIVDDVGQYVLALKENLLRAHGEKHTRRKSIKGRRKIAGWDHNFFLRLITVCVCPDALTHPETPGPPRTRAITIRPSMSNTTTPNLFSRTEPLVAYRGIHLDLKGLAPTHNRMLELLDLLAALRINVVLVEWEDTWPWRIDPGLRSPRGYTPEQVNVIAERCRTLGIALVPQVQSLGHMENVLRLPQYAHLREVPERTDCLNPLAEGAGELIAAMVDELLDALPDTCWLHLGGDEAWTFGQHPQTAAYVQQHGEAALFLHHIEPLLQRVTRRGVRPILWHDMLAHWSDDDLARVAEHADLMVWGYGGTPDDPEHHDRRTTLERLDRLGVPMWGAGAYKGADGPHRDLPDAEPRRINILGWTAAAPRYHLRGVVATAWSRYAFSRVQVEPIDACLAELAMAAAVMHEGDWPDNGWQRCEAMLDTLGQLQRATALRDHLRELQATRDEAWLRTRQLKEHLAGVTCEPQRGDGGMAAFLLEHALPWIERVDTLGRTLVLLLEPSVGRASAEAYAQTWSIALQTEAQSLHERIARLADRPRTAP